MTTEVIPAKGKQSDRKLSALSTALTDSATLRRLYGCFPSGVTALCAISGGKPVGMAVSSFTSVSLTPALVAVCAQNTSGTWPVLRDAARLGISVLGEGHEAACRALASKGDRFTDVDWQSEPTGAVFINDAAAWLECSVHDEVLAGDHVIVVLRIEAFWSNPEAAPLVFHSSRFRQLVAS